MFGVCACICHRKGDGAEVEAEDCGIKCLRDHGVRLCGVTDDATAQGSFGTSCGVLNCITDIGCAEIGTP